MQLEAHLDPCTHCGACLSFCAWDRAEAEGRPAGPELCRPCQVCYRICPRLPHDAPALAHVLFPEAQETPWGLALATYSARAAEPPAGAQDAGVVTRLAQFLLAERRADAILVSGRDADWRPQSFWAVDAAGIERAAGSKYSTAPALASLAEGLERFGRVAVVTLPCQSAALARLAQTRADLRERVVLVVGLFCTESFFHGGAAGGLTRLIEERVGRPLAEVERCDIQRGRLLVRMRGVPDVAEWRMKELHDIVWPICLSCQDLTAEFADVSIGSIGSGEGTNSLIVRSQRGQDIVEAGARAGLWTLAPLEQPEALQKQCERKRGNPERLSEDERVPLGRASVRGNWKRRARNSAA